MTTITVTTRSVQKDIYTFEIPDTTTLENFVILLKDKAGLSDEYSVKLITKGKQLTDADMKNDFKQFKGVNPEFVFMTKVVKPVVKEDKVTTKHVEDKKSTEKLTYLTPPSEVDMSLKFDTRQVHMYTLKLLNYVAKNPTLRTLCMTSPDTLLSVFEKSSNMKLIHTLLKESQTSLDELDSGYADGKVTSFVPVAHEAETTLSESETEETENTETEETEDFESTDTLTTSTLEQQLVNQITSLFSGSGFTPTFITGGHSMIPQIPAVGTGGGPVLSEEDKDNIQKIVDMGFSEQQAKRAYLISGKNVDVALTVLLTDA